MGSAQGGLETAHAREATPGATWRHALWPSRKVESFVVSFPKSGRTWLRVMMAVVEAHGRGDDPEAMVAKWLDQDAPGLDAGRVLFTHALSANAHERVEAMDHFLGYIGDRPRVFLVRDPRDVIVSYFFQVAKRQGGSFREDELGRFLRDPGYGIDRLLRFHRACDRSLRSDPGPSLLVSYEELRRDPRCTLRSVLEFLSGSTPEDGLDAGVAFGRFENMRRLELEGAFDEPSGRLAVPYPDDVESLKTRRGVVGGFREYLTGSDLAHVESRIEELMPPALGYGRPGEAPGTRARERDS